MIKPNSHIVSNCAAAAPYIPFCESESTSSIVPTTPELEAKIFTDQTLCRDAKIEFPIHCLS